MKLLCDEMLKGLARWLRAAGHDTELAAAGESDRALLARARRDGRLLLTRDRKLLEHRGAHDDVRLLDCNGLDDCARALTAQTGIDWLYRPFSRCLICNTALQALAGAADSALPDDVKHGPLYRCPTCARVYWEGGHVRRMQARLTQWSRAGAGDTTAVTQP